MNFNGILIGSEDPKRLADYYRKLFGEPGWDGDGYTGWMIGSGAVTVGPHSEVHGANGEPGCGCDQEQPVQVPDVADEAQVFRRCLPDQLKGHQRKYEPRRHLDPKQHRVQHRH